MEGSPPTDLAPLLEAASDFASYPGTPNDASAKEFLDRVPLPVLLGALQNESDVPGVEDAIAACLDRLFKTRYGAALIPQYFQFVQEGLQAKSETVRCLACKAVFSLLENNEDNGTALQIINGYNIYPLLINCLVDGDEQTSAASLNAIKKLAQFPEGIRIVFPANGEGSSQLKHMASNCSSLSLLMKQLMKEKLRLGLSLTISSKPSDYRHLLACVARIRILALITKLFSLSSSVALAVHDSNLLNLFEAEINNGNDILTSLSALELLYELVESPYSSRILSKTTLLQLLTDLISNASVDSVLHSRAMLISGRLLSSNDAYGYIGSSSVIGLLLAIDERLKLLRAENTDECEIALETLGQIGASIPGASLLLTSTSPVARHVIESAFDRHSRGKQLAGLHALGSICGVDRPDDSVLLDDNAEDCLRRLIYVTASETPKLTPSGLLLSALQQEPEIRLAAYRLVAALVARKWCLMEVCSKQEIITIVTDANIETQKNGMEARHLCCTAISKAFSASNMLNDAAVAEIVGKLQEAVRRGPYLVKRRIEAQPIVVTEERF